MKLRDDRLQINEKNLLHILPHAFCFHFLRIHTIAFSEEALKLCEHNFFHEI